ncbi:hypothetical protein HY256_07755 [Candidatus Sumerlaeota bacterium]|nr:hypothetical protein [Candidatus Sumerlaeota bacterium]
MIGLIHPFDISARPSRARAGRSALWTLACSLLFFAGCRKEETVAINLPAEKSAPPSLTPEAAHAGLTLPNRPGLYLALGDKTVELPKGGRPIRSGGEVQIVFYDKNAAKYGNWNLRRYSVNAETK